MGLGGLLVLLLVLAALGAFVADRYGQVPLEVVAVIALVAVDVAMMAGLVAVAGAENCDGGGGWQCSRVAAIALALGVPGVTFASGFLLIRGLGRDP